MKTIMVMFDSLNRRMLPPYGAKGMVAPNFERLAKRTVAFDNSYVGSMPCMPARRELHTGRYNFLHASWGPIEPFDDSMPEILKHHGIYSHLISDHYHYWEDGGCTYHSRYSSWEIVRGQEGDYWKGNVGEIDVPDSLNNRGPDGSLYSMIRQDWVNRSYLKTEEDFPQAQTFGLGLEFIEKNHNQDNWFLQIETFDPHEPFHSPQKYKDLYPHSYNGRHYDWPPYAPISESEETVQHMQAEYSALLSMCDTSLGKVLDAMDRYDLWKDTLLIVNTDHGYLLGEHGWWAKCFMPFYNEVAHTPLFVWDPRFSVQDEHRQSLVQTIDLAPTVLDFFRIPLPKNMQGVPLNGVVSEDRPVRDAALYGIFGGHVNVTDGRYTYMRAPTTAENIPLYEYTLMPVQHMRERGFIEVERMKDAQLVEPLPFTKGYPVMKIPGKGKGTPHKFGTLLFDLASDPAQEHPLKDEQLEQRMIEKMVRLMKENDCPEEQYERLGLRKG